MTDTAFSIEATVALAELEQIHGQVKRVFDEVEQAQELLALTPTGTRLYMCEHCCHLFTIEPDGEARVWFWDKDRQPYSFSKEDLSDDRDDA